MGAVRRRAADRAGRPRMRSPGRPPVARREHRQRFWEAIARGVASEDAGVAAGGRVAVVAGVWRHATVGLPATHGPLRRATSPGPG
jgi:hypothetical protein